MDGENLIHALGSPQGNRIVEAVTCDVEAPAPALFQPQEGIEGKLHPRDPAGDFGREGLDPTAVGGHDQYP